MSEVAKEPLSSEHILTMAELSAFAETGPSVAQIVGWLSTRCDSYVYLIDADGSPQLHAGTERAGESVMAAIPGEDFALVAVGGVTAETLAHVALITSAALARQRADVMSEAKNHGDLLRSLIAGDSEAVARAQDEGWKLDRDVFMIVARFESDRAENIAEQWRTVIRQRDPQSFVVYFPSELVAVLNRESIDPRIFVESLPRETADVAFSRVGNAATDLGRLYNQCDIAINVARNIGRLGVVSTLDDLGAYRLLALVDDSADLRNFVHDHLRELAFRSDLEAVDLRRTLQVLLDQNLNIAETARVMHFHYNTLRYRVAKLERMLGNFTTDAELRLSISLALRVIQLRGI